MAPGVSVYAPYPGNRYATSSGTSHSAPFVAGVAALVNQAANHLLGGSRWVGVDFDRDRPLRYHGGDLPHYEVVEIEDLLPGEPVSLIEPPLGLRVLRDERRVRRLAVEKPEEIDLTAAEELDVQEEQVLQHATDLSVSELAKLPESQTLEFKSSMRYDRRNGGANKALEQVIARSVAGLMNARGGVLLIGVADDGEILGIDDFHELAGRLRDAAVEFVIEPYLRFAGEPGEQWTMFFRDPAGNALEFKAFRDESQVFAK